MSRPRRIPQTETIHHLVRTRGVVSSSPPGSPVTTPQGTTRGDREYSLLWVSFHTTLDGWKERCDNHDKCNSLRRTGWGFMAHRTVLNMPVSPVHLRESPLEKADRRHRLALTARGGVRFCGVRENPLPLCSPVLSRLPCQLGWQGSTKFRDTTGAGKS